MGKKLRVQLRGIPALPPGHQTVRQALLLTVNTELADTIEFALDATSVEFEVEDGADCILVRRQFTEAGAAVHQIDSAPVKFRPSAEVAHPNDVDTAIGVLTLIRMPAPVEAAVPAVTPPAPAVTPPAPVVKSPAPVVTPPAPLAAQPAPQPMSGPQPGVTQPPSTAPAAPIKPSGVTEE